VSPSQPAREDVFLHVLEIGDRDSRPPRRVVAIEGHQLDGAAIGGEAVVLFADAEEGEATLPDVETKALLLAGLHSGAAYELQVTSSVAPGAPAWRGSAVASDESAIFLSWDAVRGGRLRVRRLRP
jgi:hypothetical protein